MKKLIICFIAILLWSNAWAQNSYVDNLGDELSYKEISAQLKSIEAMTKESAPDIRALVEKTSYLNETFSLLISSRQNIDLEVKLIEKRLDALGDKNEETGESKVIAQKRKEFSAELKDEKARLSEIDILLAKIEEINLRIFEARNQMLWGNMLKSDLRLINPAVLWRVNRELVGLLADIVKSPVSAYDEYKEDKNSGFGVAVFKFLSLLIVIAIVGYYLRRWMIERWGYRKELENIRLGNKIAASVSVWCAYGIIPTAIVLYCWFHLNQIAFWNNDLLKMVLRTTLYYVLFVIMGRAIARVVLTPYNEKWRLINMSTYKAKRLFKAINFTIYTVGIFSILLAIVAKQNYSIELLAYLMALSATVRAVCMVWLAYIYFTSDNDKKESDEAASAAKARASRIGVLVTLFAAVVIGLAFCGYARLAFFAVNRTLLSLIAIFAYSILRRFFYDVARRVLFMALWVKSFRVRRIFLRKVDFWFGLAVEPLMVLALITGLLILWGMPIDVLQNIALFPVLRSAE